MSRRPKTDSGASAARSTPAGGARRAGAILTDYSHYGEGCARLDRPRPGQRSARRRAACSPPRSAPTPTAPTPAPSARRARSTFSSGTPGSSKSVTTKTRNDRPQIAREPRRPEPAFQLAAHRVSCSKKTIVVTYMCVWQQGDRDSRCSALGRRTRRVQGVVHGIRCSRMGHTVRAGCFSRSARRAGR